MFDCGGVCPYDIVPKHDRARTGQERKALSRLGNLLSRWFLHAQRLFHLVVGLAFMFLAAAGAAVTFSEWQYYREAPEVGPARIGVVGGFTVLLTILCLYSFVKARNVR